ncbi:MbtH family protein [Peterkaempfera sp. SMS 1(5)a]|uniref:MbtH family protein n=1 Tax=Peterkaempfera podocarpi TaxID=3232308 RepID=UPI00366F24B5
MTNPFEDESGPYLVLVNEEGQHSLWPAYIAVPAGWTVALAAAPRSECLAHIEKNWVDMRPLSLVHATAARTGAGRA